MCSAASTGAHRDSAPMPLNFHNCRGRNYTRRMSASSAAGVTIRRIVCEININDGSPGFSCSKPHAKINARVSNRRYSISARDDDVVARTRRREARWSFTRLGLSREIVPPIWISSLPFWRELYLRAKKDYIFFIFCTRKPAV